MEKICSKCNNIKNLLDFHKNKNSNDGRMNICKLCRKINRKLIIYTNCINKKICPRCNQEKSSNEFNKDKSSKTGLQTYCKKCGHINQKIYYTNGGINVFIKALYKDLIRNAKKRNINVYITEKNILDLYYKQNGLCNLTGEKMTFDKYMSNNSRLKNINNISVDRIDSTLDYFINNVHLVCVKINIIKWDLKLEDFINTCKLVVNYTSNI